MPNWKEVLAEIGNEHQRNLQFNALDIVRRKYLKRASEISNRNTIAYYSGWL
jgi:hypothetical protein